MLVGFKWAAEYLPSKPMLKQFVSFNTFVSHQTLPYSSCDGLCTDQNDTAANVHLAMTLPSFAQNFPKPVKSKHLMRSKWCERRAKHEQTQFASNSTPSNVWPEIYKWNASNITVICLGYCKWPATWIYVPIENCAAIFWATAKITSLPSEWTALPLSPHLAQAPLQNSPTSGSIVSPATHVAERTENSTRGLNANSRACANVFR